ncbi:WXG100 family type VII secretion target [Amycolatopsis sp. NPDC004368]
MASADGALVNTDVMRQGAQTIHDTGEQIGQVDTQVDNTMLSLFETWQADSANLFNEAMGQFHQTVRNIIDKLNELMGQVNTGAANYDQQDGDNNATVRAQAAQIGTPLTPAGLPGM